MQTGVRDFVCSLLHLTSRSTSSSRAMDQTIVFVLEESNWVDKDGDALNSDVDESDVAEVYDLRLRR